MKFARRLIGVVLLSGLCNDMGLEFSIRIVRMTTKGSALLEKLEDVDHQTYYRSKSIITHVNLE